MDLCMLDHTFKPREKSPGELLPGRLIARRHLLHSLGRRAYPSSRRRTLEDHACCKSERYQPALATPAPVAIRP